MSETILPVTDADSMEELIRKNLAALEAEPLGVQNRAAAAEVLRQLIHAIEKGATAKRFLPERTPAGDRHEVYYERLRTLWLVGGSMWNDLQELEEWDGDDRRHAICLLDRMTRIAELGYAKPPKRAKTDSAGDSTAPEETPSIADQLVCVWPHDVPCTQENWDRVCARRREVHELLGEDEVRQLLAASHGGQPRVLRV